MIFYNSAFSDSVMKTNTLFVCDICQKKLSTRKTVRMHIQNIHKVDPENPVRYHRVLVSPRVVKNFLNRGSSGQVKAWKSDKVFTIYRTIGEIYHVPLFFFILIFRLDDLVLMGLEILVWIQKYWSQDTKVLVPGYESTGSWIQKYWSRIQPELMPEELKTFLRKMRTKGSLW